MSITTTNYDAAKKKNGNSYSWWWLRSAYSSNIPDFFTVRANGDLYAYGSSNTRGFSPAFRIG